MQKICNNYIVLVLANILKLYFTTIFSFSLFPLTGQVHSILISCWDLSTIFRNFGIRPLCFNYFVLSVFFTLVI